MTAVILVRSYDGFGLHLWFSVFRNFPNLYKNSIFVSVAEIDSGSFKRIAEIEALKRSTRMELEKYVTLRRSVGIPADYRMEEGTDVVDTAVVLCEKVLAEFRMATVFAGKAVFRREHLFYKMLHNETAYAIQRRLLWKGIPVVILPVRITR